MTMVRLIDKYFHLKEYDYVLNLFCPYVPVGQLGFGGFGGKRGPEGRTGLHHIFQIIVLRLQHHSHRQSDHHSIPDICHFLYTGRIFKFKILHLKIPKIYPQKSQMCSFFAFNLEKFTPDRNFYTGSARGARDKYEVCVYQDQEYMHHSDQDHHHCHRPQEDGHDDI